MATVNDILLRVRRKIGDMQKIKISDPELIQSLNEAIDTVSMELISSSEPLMIKTLTISGNNKVKRPVSFIKFVGQYPLKGIVDFLISHLNVELLGFLDHQFFVDQFVNY